MYIRNLVASSVFNLARPSGNSRRLSEMARQFLPYALYQRKDGRFLVLNRQYKPLGFPSRNDHFFDYDSDDFLLLTLTPEQVRLPQLEPGPYRMHMLYRQSPWHDAASANEYRATIQKVFGFKSVSESGENEF